MFGYELVLKINSKSFSVEKGDEKVQNEVVLRCPKVKVDACASLPSRYWFG